jgi:hypothetical protein
VLDEDVEVGLLRLTARAVPEDQGAAGFREAASRVRDWSRVASLADAHGLAPLLHQRLLDANVEVPIEARQQIFAAWIRRRDASRAQCTALAEILETFQREQIDVVVLKGGALAHVLYPSFELRPLGDLDLLVAPRQARRAQAALAAMGFAAPQTPDSKRLVSHHHLPAAVRQRGGQLVQVEIHTDALTRDVTGSITLDRLTSPRQRFSVLGQPAETLGPLDMLAHLCRHAAERATLLRLIWVADIVGYASRYDAMIDWDRLRRTDPFVLNAIGLFHLVTPLPPALQARVPLPRRDLNGVGVACRPLSETLSRNHSSLGIARDLFWPSEWWLRLHYGVGDRASITRLRFLTHPTRVSYWFVRRATAYARWTLMRRRSR